LQAICKIAFVTLLQSNNDIMGHHHHHQPTISGKNLLITILLNVGITVAQIIGGFVSGSLALLSDAMHNLTDVLALIISFVANYLSRKKKQDLSKTFGYKRAEIIAAFINATTLIIIAFLLIVEAIKRQHRLGVTRAIFQVQAENTAMLSFVNRRMAETITAQTSRWFSKKSLI
jgi:cation diffusion facilitator family transporter